MQKTDIAERTCAHENRKCKKPQRLSGDQTILKMKHKSSQGNKKHFMKCAHCFGENGRSSSYAKLKMQFQLKADFKLLLPLPLRTDLPYPGVQGERIIHQLSPSSPHTRTHWITCTSQRNHTKRYAIALWNLKNRNNNFKKSHAVENKPHLRELQHLRNKHWNPTNHDLISKIRNCAKT